MKIRTVFIALLLLACAAPTQPQTRSPADTVGAFYKFSNARSPIFNRRHIESRKRWYTPELYRLFLEELREQTVFLKQHPDEKPFFGDGLDFRPLSEPCKANGKSYQRSQSISRSEAGKNRAYVDVKFAYPVVCTRGGNLLPGQSEEIGWPLANRRLDLFQREDPDPGNEGKLKN